MLTIDEFVAEVRKGRKINCSNVEERTQSLILLQELGFEFCDTTDIFDDDTIFLYPGIIGYGDNPEKITCWYDITEMHFIPYQHIPFEEYYSLQEPTKEEFDKDFELLMKGV